MRRKLPRYYWDTNCFIALLTRERTTDEATLNALEQTYDDMLAHKVEVVTCDLVRTEVLLPEQEKDQFITGLLACRTFELLETRSNTHDLAGSLRERCKSGSVCVPRGEDALHIACAILCRAGECWTTEKDLVSLNRRGVIHEVRICRPHVDQPRLRLEY